MSDADTFKAAFDQLRNDTQTIQDNSELTLKLLAALCTAQNNLASAAMRTVDSDWHGQPDGLDSVQRRGGRWTLDLLRLSLRLQTRRHPSRKKAAPDGAAFFR